METPAYKTTSLRDGGQMILQARFLAYSLSTWVKHSAALKKFVQFCNLREMSIFESTPYAVNLFILKKVQDGDTYGTVQSFLDSLAFVQKFFESYNFTCDPMINVVKRFAEKTCEHRKNAKNGFGSVEVRKMWDALESKYGSVMDMPKKELRTFVLAVFQHQTFCRFSDAAKIKLADIFHEVDYFKITISCSKTDQKGEGQCVFIPKSSSPFRNAHMLLCLYINKMGFNDVENNESLYLFPPLK